MVAKELSAMRNSRLPCNVYVSVLDSQTIKKLLRKQLQMCDSSTLAQSHFYCCDWLITSTSLETGPNLRNRLNRKSSTLSKKHFAKKIVVRLDDEQSSALLADHERRLATNELASCSIMVLLAKETCELNFYTHRSTTSRIIWRFRCKKKKKKKTDFFQKAMKNTS